MKPYQPVASHVRERLEIAALVAERLDLQWADEVSDQAYMARVEPREVVEQDGRVYLLARDAQGAELRIRLDLIRNLPMPVK
ncbi:hypothetical protein [Acidihalobacter ferrooxydans]|uniref:Uncharacterized protein n=1 Tax=Acidihalobacter ferrooxydans TaxID=1765967 RepID=A0A1P8UG14_9GAMM|nr:hypothetical protein [Acidihalobacter ferrooxydans]APZ42711.1 hypothetical protein BW247_06045 [Acidihalobacter ferrooxydans]